MRRCVACCAYLVPNNSKIACKRKANNSKRACDVHVIHVDLPPCHLAYHLPLCLPPLPPQVSDESVREALRLVLSSSQLSEHFAALARDLDVLEPKMPEEVYKSHLVDGR